MNNGVTANRSFLSYWLWIWPALGLGIIGLYVLELSTWEHNPHCLWVYSLLGSVLAGWTWLRTRDRRYMLPFLAMFTVGFLIYWPISRG